ncbi:sugar-transfer associated ATP-grasp domain-containing protein [Kriegella aquimaris]|uniref:Sugar-transfer associated ATP-grasp n=1 Tax=Kriegella aquimaris TaxID=192904 RepID=A0A1G9U745_9FLAO|nr:sugar-transfer associated ATP-grasp domain-containing protein [Kriegella aquimaris]SDM55662.1 Sugar-transfer associated ATP-grasp [Kriegella aquimaris]
MPPKEKVKLFAKKTEDKLLVRRYHYISNRQAFKALEEVEKDNGKLTSKSKKIVDEYAVDILGWKGFAPWLYVYTAINGSFKEGWIPDNYYFKKVVPKIQGEYGKISFLKSLNNLIFQKEVGPDIVYFINGFWFGRNFEAISTEKLETVLFREREVVVCKSDQSCQGSGVYVIRKEEFDLNAIQKIGNCTIQSYIEQHPFFNAFLSDSVATIRMTTVVDSENRISLRACYLRLGRCNDTHIKSINHIRIPITIKDGMLHEQGYLANWKVVYEHPDSKLSFAGKYIPNYKECVQLVLQLHERMPMVRSIGWDIIVDAAGHPIVMEWNGYSNDIKFSEATQGPCFKDLNWNLL